MELQNRIIDYIVVCINDFAAKFNLDCRDAFQYLQKFGGLNFIEEFYDVEHTLSIEDAIEDMTMICRQNGGNIG